MDIIKTIIIFGW